MSSSLSQAQQDELKFVKNHLDKLSQHPVKYANDFSTPDENKPRKPPMVGIQVPEIQEPKAIGESKQTQDTISITIKCLKPPLTYSLPSVSVSDPISTLKSTLSSSNPTAPPPDVQRLLFKGKALADNKLLKEYEGITDGAVVNMMVKAGWTPGSTTSSTASPSCTSAVANESLQRAPGQSHTRTASSSSIPSEIPPADPTSPSAIPSLTLSMPSSSQQTPMPINSTQVSTVNTTTSKHYHDVVADPRFWTELYSFAKARFLVEGDAEEFWESVLRGEKGKMSANDVAKARDATGVFGMAGV